jgi:ABC-type transport system involved in cytochrome bd biosynthesis fused ATPase/permease subunit
MKCFFQNPDFQEKYFAFLRRLLQFDKHIQFLNIDINKPWWYVLLKRKYSLLLVIISECVQAVYEAFFPLAVGYAILQQKYEYIVYVVGIYILFEIMNRVALYIYDITFGILLGSLMHAVQSFFFKTDPLNHVIRSTGKTLSKIQVLNFDLPNLCANMFFIFLPIVISYFTVTLAFFSFDISLGVVALIFFICITAISVFLRYFTLATVIQFRIKARDEFITNLTENIIQIIYIRSIFATPEANKKALEVQRNGMIIRQTSSWAEGIVVFITRLLYITSVAVVGYFILLKVQTGSMNTVIATSLILTYINGSHQILRIGNFISQSLESIENLNDLFTYIRGFGKQTFPVLPEDVKTDES